MSVFETIYGFGEYFQGSHLDQQWITQENEGILLFTYKDHNIPFYGISCLINPDTNIMSISEENKEKVDKLYEKVKNRHCYTDIGYYSCIRGYSNINDMEYSFWFKMITCIMYFLFSLYL